MRSTGSSICLFISLLACEGITQVSYAGFERRYAGARALGAAGAAGTFVEDCWSFYCNPARSANFSELDVFYFPTTFGLSEIRSTGISGRSNFEGFDIGGAAQTFGYDLYRESVFTLNVSRPVSDFFFLGVNLNFNHLFIKDYGTQLGVSVDAGTKIFLSENFCVSLSSTNLNSASMTLSNDRLPQTLTCGCAFLSNEMNVGVEYFKELGFPSAVKLTAEYSPIRPVTLRAGTVSGTNSIHAGLTLRFLSFELEYGAGYHQVLGLTHAVGLTFRLFDSDRTEFESISEYRQSLRR